MKKLFTLIAYFMAILVSSCSEYDDTEIWNKLSDHENRIVKLEELCRQMNTNITALQTIVNALQKNDYITNVAPVREDGKIIGYTITFAYSDTITIYHGEDGVDGEDGADGQNGKDGYTPKIGVMKDSDGVYYWTVDGEWLLDAKGNKIKAQGIDGSNGANGIDGITPRLKIEDDYWYVSYDDGVTWTELDKATGEDGANGSNGEDGDSIFSGVTQDDEYVYFNLSDGTMITLPKHDKENIQFEDLQVKVICCKNWDTNNDGELSYAEAAAVSDIGEAFSENADIIAFPELKYFTGIKEIPVQAFYQCSRLWKIVLPTQITKIREHAFSYCYSLQNINIPNSVTSIERSVFQFCKNLKRITLSDNLLLISGSLFSGCISLTDIAIPDKVTSIGDNAFVDCNSLKNIVIGNSVTIIYQRAFQSCNSLMNVVLPNSVVEIGEGAFISCDLLTDVEISNNITNIGSSAFYDCKSLKNVYCKETIPPIIGEKAFHRQYASDGYVSSVCIGCNIYVPTASAEKYKSSWTQYSKFIIGYDF